MNMTMSLSADVEQFIQRQVATGAFRNPEEVIEEAIRQMKQRASADFHLGPQVEGVVIDMEDECVFPPCELPRPEPAHRIYPRQDTVAPLPDAIVYGEE